MTIWRMRFACLISNATNAHSQYVTLIAFPLQQRLHERASMLRCTYMACLVLFSVCKTPGYVRVLICSAICLLIAALTLTVAT